VLCDQTMKLLFVLFGFPGIAICEESRGTLTVYSRKRVHFLAAILVVNCISQRKNSSSLAV